MNLKDYQAGGYVVERPVSNEYQRNEDEESLPDRWIKDRLNVTIAEVISALDEYRFNEAATSIYQFIWHEFCDWYLEMIKPVLYGKGSPGERLATQHTLFTVLKTSLKLLHPFMPFVTEEIWQTLVKDGTSIMVSEFPSVIDDRRDPDAQKKMGLIMEVISKIRNIRGEMNIAPSKRIEVIISVPEVADGFSRRGEEKLNAIMEMGRDYIVDLAHLERLAIGTDLEEPKGAATGVVGSMRIFVLLEGMIDIAAERARLEKEMVKVTREMTLVSKKLANRDFLAKAAETVIKKEEGKFRELRDKHIILEAAIRKVQEMRVL